MNELLQFIGLSAFAFSLTVATPMEILRRRIGVSNSDRCTGYLHLVQELMNCAQCMGFWIGLVHYETLWGGGLIFLGARLTEWLWFKIPINTRL